jgi:hypothetical protein
MDVYSYMYQHDTRKVKNTMLSAVLEWAQSPLLTTAIMPIVTTISCLVVFLHSVRQSGGVDLGNLNILSNV